MGFDFETWLLLAGVTGICLLSILYTLARYFGAEREVHDLKVRVIDLRKTYHRRLAMQEGIIEAEVVGDGPSAPGEPTAQTAIPPKDGAPEARTAA